MTTQSVDAATVALSAGISAGVAALVSVTVNLLLGGPMEVRKQRSLERELVRRELSESIRLQLNAVRAFGPGLVGWKCAGGKVVEFEDAFQENYDEMVASYLAIRRHLVGMEGVEPQDSVGRVIRIAGAYAGRVHNFRADAIGNPPEPLETHRADIRSDMESALALLKQTRDVLSGGAQRQYFRLSRLRKRVGEIEELGRARLEPRTPLSYPRADGAHVQRLRVVADEEDSGVYVHLYADLSDGRAVLLLKGDSSRVSSLKHASRDAITNAICASVGIDTLDTCPAEREADREYWLHQARVIGRAGIGASVTELCGLPRDIELRDRLSRRLME